MVKIINRTRGLLVQRRQFLLYGLIGASGALLDLILFLILFNKFGVNPILATAISTSTGILNNFIWNARFNFKVTNKLHHRFALFYFVGICGLFLSMAIIFLLHDRLTLNANIAKIISIPLVVIFQYFLNARFSFAEELRTDEILMRLVVELKRNYEAILVWLLAIVSFILSSYCYIGFDELSNILNGRLILHGQMPYVGFFSHHMPGMYFLSALIYPLANHNVFDFRLVFNLILLVLLYLSYHQICRHVSKAAGLLWVILVSAGHIVGFGNTALAESLIVFVYAACMIKIFFSSVPFTVRDSLLLGLGLFLIPFFSLSYFFVVLVLYVVYFVRLLKIWHSDKNGKKLLFHIGGLAVWPVLLLATLVATGSLKQFIFQNLTFNANYYAPLVSGRSTGVVRTLTTAVQESVSQIDKVLTHFYSPHYLMQLILLAGWFLFVYVLVRRRRYLLALAAVVSLLVIDPQVNVFNPGAISAQLSSVSQHGLMYFNTALLLGVIGLTLFFKNWRVGRLALVLGCIPAIVLVAGLINQNKLVYTNVFSPTSTNNNYLYANSLKVNNAALIVNNLVKPNEYAWIGPADFASQIYLEPHRATIHTFFMPWQDSCPICRKNFLNDFRQQKPKIIFWGGYTFKGHEYRYNSEVTNYIHRHFFVVKDPRLSNFYFNNHDRIKLVKELNEHGYET